MLWATFTGGTLGGQERRIGTAGAISWPERYELISTGEVWRHVGAGYYRLETPQHPLPVARKGPAMHPADRLALSAVACFAAGVVALAPVVWRTFEDRWLNAVFAVTAAMALIATGWLAQQWSELGAHEEGTPT